MNEYIKKYKALKVDLPIIENIIKYLGNYDFNSVEKVYLKKKLNEYIDKYI